MGGIAALMKVFRQILTALKFSGPPLLAWTSWHQNQNQRTIRILGLVPLCPEEGVLFSILSAGSPASPSEFGAYSFPNILHVTCEILSG